LSENIDFKLDDENLRGLDAFFRSAVALGLIVANQPIRSAAGAKLPVAASVLGKPW
jgi:hypothetical protein